MRLGVMLGDILRALVRGPITERYPLEQRPTPERGRGLLHYDASKCTGCSLCVQDCPAQALELTIVDRKAKRFVMRHYVDRCTFCGQCTASCRFNCITLDKDDWALAAADRAPFHLVFGSEADVAAVANAASGGSSQTG